MKTSFTSRFPFFCRPFLIGFALCAVGLFPARARLSQWETTDSMASARYSHTATLLPSGQVLVAGGYAGRALSSAELYRPALRVWTMTGSMSAARYDQTATLLASGEVLVAGGTDGATAIWRSAELYDPATMLWTATDGMGTARINHTATLLPSGQVLVAGDTIMLTVP